MNGKMLLGAAAVAAALGLGVTLALSPWEEGVELPPQRPMTLAAGPSQPSHRQRPLTVRAAGATVTLQQEQAPGESVAPERVETPAANPAPGDPTTDVVDEVEGTDEGGAGTELVATTELAADDAQDPRLVAALDEVVEELLNEEDPTTLEVLSADLASKARSISVASLTRLVTLARVGTEAQRTQAFLILAERAPTPSLTESVYKAYADNPDAKVRPHARATLEAWAAKGAVAGRYLASLRASR